MVSNNGIKVNWEILSDNGMIHLESYEKDMSFLSEFKWDNGTQY